MLGRHSKQNGVTLIETIIGVAVFAIISFAIYQSLSALLEAYSVAKVRLAASHLFVQEMELVRNLRFEDVGTVGGVPPGILLATSTKEKEGNTFDVTRTVRNIDDPFDGTVGGSPNDLSPADYKLVEIQLNCTSCSFPTNYIFSGRAAAKGLETASTNGSLFVQVLDASGQPVPNANVSILNTTLTPQVNVNDTTDLTGFLKLIDTKPAIQSYQVTVTKSGYSTDKTYATSTSNPNPTKLAATVAIQTLTQISFAIDRVATMQVESSTANCSVVPNFNFSLTGAKLIGTTPDVLKFQNSYVTNSSGLKTIANLEWDTYMLNPLDSAYDLAGVIPLFPLALAPNANQNIKLIAQHKNPSALLVTVKDITSGLPLSDALVQLTAPGYSSILRTGQGSLTQTDWSQGPGAQLFTEGFYDVQDGNLETGNPAGVITLLSQSGDYVPSGNLTSSIFDTGSPGNFWNISWDPATQPPASGVDSLKFQLASATTTNPTSWDFKGPDGTAATYYTAPDSPVSGVHAGDRYFKYRAYLSTASSTFTPTVSDFAITFSSDCVPPGQVLFSGLSNGTYTLTISRNGYTPLTQSVSVGTSWQEFIGAMTPIP